MLTFCHDTRRHENCRLWKNHHGNTVIGNTIVDTTEHRSPPKAGFYASIYIYMHMYAHIHMYCLHSVK